MVLQSTERRIGGERFTTIPKALACPLVHETQSAAVFELVNEATQVPSASVTPSCLLRVISDASHRCAVVEAQVLSHLAFAPG